MKKTYYDFAMSDYKNLEFMIENEFDDYDIIMVTCQQFFENYLKYFLELLKGESNRVHKLTVISNQLEQYIDFFRQVQDDYFDRRSPNDCYIETSKEKCDYVVSKTKEVKKLLDKILEEYSKSDSLKSSNVFDKLK